MRWLTGSFLPNALSSRRPPQTRSLKSGSKKRGAGDGAFISGGESKPVWRVCQTIRASYASRSEGRDGALISLNWRRSSRLPELGVYKMHDTR